MRASEVKIGRSMQDAKAESGSHPLNELNVLLVIRDHSHVVWHTVRGAYQPVQYTANSSTDMLVCFLNLVGACASIPGQEAPVLDRPNVPTWKWLRKAMDVKMLDQFLEDVLVVLDVGERFARIASRGQGWKVCYPSALPAACLSGT